MLSDTERVLGGGGGEGGRSEDEGRTNEIMKAFWACVHKSIA